MTTPTKRSVTSLSLSDISESDEIFSNGGSMDKSVSFIGTSEPIHECLEEEVSLPPRVPPRKPSADASQTPVQRPPVLPPRPARTPLFNSPSPEAYMPTTPLKRSKLPPPIPPVVNDAPPVPPRPPRTPLAGPLDAFSHFNLPPPGTPPPHIPPKPGKIER